MADVCNHPAEWTAEPLVSITVLNWNGERFLRRCMASLGQAICPHMELVLIDNGSTDRSVSIVEEEFPFVSVISLPRNLGVAGGRNAAVPHLRGRFIVFLDNDATVQRGWLPPLIDLMMKDPQVGIATPKVLFSGLSGRVQGVGGYLKLWTGNTGLGDGQPDDVYPPGRVIEPFFAFGAALAVRRELFEYLGGFDEQMFPTGVDDLDLAWRARLSGYKVVCLTESVVYHHVSGTRGILSHRSLALHVYHLLRTMVKCLSWPNLLHAVPAYMTYAITMGTALSIVAKNPRFLGAILWALGRFATSISELRQSRVATQELRVLSDKKALRSDGFGLCESPVELWRKLQLMNEVSRHHPAELPS